ncbi:hypothetical protein PR202_gb15074 [Eleusine coracana subsp. coracana]|uniref:NAC domain-containing protein n=1 Tax=Eleusine coracana subsp. coracana TaxID=191504 RepID=A0AAV5EXX0_ELECO|nr:hypothetical protein PR202_gb15074 [Eleusine coracana subsp. coracana]
MQSIREEDETDDGWIVLRAGNDGGAALTAPPKPAIMAITSTTAASSPGQPFDPAPDALIGRYLPLRRALRCDALPPQVYPARGGALHESLRLRIRERERAADVRPQVLVQLHLASVRAGDALRCRVHRAADVFAAHPAVLTGVLPAANDRFEWFFAVRRPRHAQSGDDGGGRARARRAGAGEYVPAGNDRCVIRDDRGRELGYRRVFRYREDDEAARSASRTAWWMEEYGFGPRFSYGEHGGDDEVVVVYKVYLRMAHR